MTNTTLYLTRHGETAWNAEARMQGWQDSPLTAQGIQQAIWLRDALSHVDFAAIYSSSSPRASSTAEILRHERACELILHNDLREIYMGSWEGQTRQTLQQNYPAAFQAFWETPHLYQPENGGESFYDLQKRVIPLIETLLTKHQGETILIVTHAGTLKTIMGYFTASPLADLWHPPIVRPTALCKVVIEQQHPLIELYGDTSHYL